MFNTAIFSDGYSHAALYERIAVRCPSLTEISGCEVDEQGLLALSMIFESTLTDIKFTRTYPLSDNEIDRLCKGCPYLTRLSVGYTNPLTDASVRSIVSYCPCIERLSLSGWRHITDDSMVTLTALSLLKEIDLSDCSELTSAGVQSLLRSIGASLEVLTLWSGDDYFECKFCNDAFLRCIGAYCPKLNELQRPGGIALDYISAISPPHKGLALG